MRLRVTEVHNFGGFFGGDTVTLSGVAWPAEGPAEQTLTIDQAALANVPDRHALAPGMVLALDFAGERVERATLLAASSHAALRGALGVPELGHHLDGPLLLAHRCARCALWVATLQEPARCPLCQAPAIAVDTATR